VPAALSIARSLDTLTVSFDPATMGTIALSPSPGLTVGYEVAVFLYPMGSARPAEPRGVTLGDGLIPHGRSTWTAARDGIPAPGTRYSVDMNVTIFETDVPERADPHSDRYRVLWTRSLHQSEE
jgi:hypothetical protein